MQPDILVVGAMAWQPLSFKMTIKALREVTQGPPVLPRLFNIQTHLTEEASVREKEGLAGWEGGI